MLDPVLRNPWVRALGVVAAFVLLGALCYLLMPVLTPLALAFFAAYILDPVVDAFERRRVRRPFTISLLAVLGIVAALAVPLYLIPSLIHQADELVRAAGAWAVNAATGPGGSLPQRVESVLRWLHLEEVLRTAGWIAPDAAPSNLLGVMAEKTAALVRANAGEVLRSFADAVSLAGRAAGYTAAAGVSVAYAVRSVGAFFIDIVVFLANFAVFAFVAGYLLSDFDGIVRGIGDLVPPRWRNGTFRLCRQVDAQLKGFLRGQLAVCACLGLMYGAGLTLSGVPFSIPIALLGMAAGFIPYLGLILTMGIAGALTLVQHGVDGHIVGVLATFAIAQALEGNVLTPRIVGQKVGLHPVWVILAVLVFGQTFGFLGLLLAVPIAAVLKVFVTEALNRYKRSALYRQDAPADRE